ncbi:MAG: hypothetical protein U0838_05720 [Chloroflexota bacterium]
MLTDTDLSDLQTKYAPAIAAGIGSILVDPRDREEAEADAVVMAWRHRTELRVGPGLGAWIRTAARWAALGIARRRRLPAGRIPDWLDDWGCIELVDRGPSPEAWTVLSEAVGRIPEPERAAMLLAAGGHGLRPIGRALGVSHDTAWRRARSGRRRLAAALGD